MVSAQPPPPPVARGAVPTAAGVRGRCSAEEFWGLLRGRVAAGAHGAVQRLMRQVLPQEAAQLVADCHVPLFPDLKASLWAAIYDSMDHDNRSSVIQQFGIYLRRFEHAARRMLPDFQWGEATREPFDGYQPPLRFCSSVLFYRLHAPVPFGSSELIFPADVLGQLTNGLFFYYREGRPGQNPGCCICAGIGRCFDFYTVVAPSLHGVLQAMTPEDRYDVATGATVPRKRRCRCKRCFAREMADISRAEQLENL